ncbi:efflux RND transporter periplasmic adaptor subunit [Nitrosovibrio sp. Nv17]|uniref:efflux RND transporter periplasmic adaptor subunit n=1 Tax=Nitrosovibrio sp. Nv17 TaxID=1855339 RepID=UPI000908A659|nr:efflux RND transporter periplasmic adaptor subunit [Nitrosovibrio sp. Nv17]SFW11596.1 membrane fusion protein, cobalt-zinc-cadmium efflux system [Nitrosovibrio sp. Nv17]
MSTTPDASRRQSFLIALVIIAGVALGGLILTLDKAPVSGDGHGHAGGSHAAHDDSGDHGGHEDEAGHDGHEHDDHDDHDHGHDEDMHADEAGDGSGKHRPARGPRGGKLFVEDGFGVEVTLFEKGVPPQLRLYLYENGKPLPPAAARITVTLARLGAPAQVFGFSPENDYLLGDQVVDEPHSFDMAIAAEYGEKSFRWGYSQVEARITLSDDVLRRIGVEIRTAGPATIRPRLSLPGEIVYDEHTIVQVVPRLPGIVTAVHRHHGQQVEKGEVLAVMESQVLAELRAQFLAARKRLDLARITHDREKRLWEEKISAMQDYLAARQALDEAGIAADLALARLRTLGIPPGAMQGKGNLARYEIRAPNRGLITAKAIAQGQTLKEDAAIFTIADISTLWAHATVYERDLEKIRVGSRAVVRSTALGIEAEGVVSYVSTLIGAQTRSATARIVLDNRAGHWLPGMFVTADVVTEEIAVPVAVSRDAIQTLNDWSVVFGRYGQYLEARPLKLGRSDETMVEVRGGISAGERYAAGNSFAVKAELGKAGASHDH